MVSKVDSSSNNSSKHDIRVTAGTQYPLKKIGSSNAQSYYIKQVSTLNQEGMESIVNDQSQSMEDLGHDIVSSANRSGFLKKGGNF